MSLDVAVVVGHDAVSQGATAVDGFREWAFFGPVAELVVSDLRKRGLEGRVFLRPTRGTYEQKMRALCAEINAAAPALVVELHFNAGASGAPRTSALHWPTSTAGAAAASVLASRVARALAPGRAHRVVDQARSWSTAEDLDGDGKPDPAGPPMWILRLTRAPAVILETHFGDDATDHELARRARFSCELPHAIAAGIAAAIRELP